jgi:hypothetical protein
LKNPAPDEIAEILHAAIDAHEKLDDQEKEQSKKIVGVVLAAKRAACSFDIPQLAFQEQMVELVTLAAPKCVLEWVETVNGFGLPGLALILGATGDLTAIYSPIPEECNYTGPAKVWKRMGLAVIDGCAQGHPTGVYMDADGVLHKEKVSNDMWAAHGYCPARRSIMHVIGDVLHRTNNYGRKRQSDGTLSEGTPGRYNQAYLEYRAQDEQKHPDFGFSKTGKKVSMHYHMRALRITEKLLLKDLWNMWNFGEIKDGWVEMVNER